MIDVLKIHSKSLKYTIGKLTEARRTPIYFDSSVGSRDGGCRPLPVSIMMQFLSLLLVLHLLQIIYFATSSDDCF